MKAPSLIPKWKRVLRDCGYPTDVVVVDLETYWDQDYSLKKMSTVEYIMDERFEVLGCAFHASDGDAWFEHKLDKNYFAPLQYCTVVMHNAHFDASILAWRYGIHLPFVVDNLALARHVHGGGIKVGGSLKALAERYGLPPKGDTVQFKGLRWDNILVAQRQILEDYAKHDAWLEWELFKILLPKLSRPEVELPLIQHTLELFTKPPMEVDHDEAEKLMEEFDQPIVQACGNLALTRKDISGTNSFRRLLETELLQCGDKLPLKQGKPTRTNPTGKILALAKTDAGLARLRSHQSKRVRQLVEARASIKSAPLHIKRIRKICGQAKPLGSLPVPLAYCGTRTGRPAGTGGINLLNLPKHDPDKRRIRNILVPPKGHKFIIVDASQIEARLTAWIADQEDKLDVFRRGEDPYLDLASKIAGEPVTDKDDPRRQLGKIGELSCGFGTGAEKLMNTANTTFGLDIDFGTAYDIVNVWRRSNPMVTRLWSRIERAFKYTVKWSRPANFSHGLKFFAEDDAIKIRLPSGRCLFYYKAHFVYNRLRVQSQKHPDLIQDIWGSFLLENIVQSMSRDHLSEALLKVEALFGYRVVLHVYDSLIVSVPEDQAEYLLPKIIDIMNVPPEWAQGIPLASAGGIYDRFE